MRRRLCAAILFFESIVLGLSTPVLISVESVSTTAALVVGLGLCVACLVVAGLLRFAWGFGLGWVVQVAAVALGFQISAMFVLGTVFLVLWVTAFRLGGTIDEARAAAD